MQVLKKVVGFWAQGKAVSRSVGMELSHTDLVLVSGGSPKGGWGTQLTVEPDTLLASASPKGGW
jgi:hypothetical protein